MGDQIRIRSQFSITFNNQLQIKTSVDWRWLILYVGVIKPAWCWRYMLVDGIKPAWCWHMFIPVTTSSSRKNELLTTIDVSALPLRENSSGFPSPSDPSDTSPRRKRFRFRDLSGDGGICSAKAEGRAYCVGFHSSNPQMEKIGSLLIWWWFTFPPFWDDYGYNHGFAWLINQDTKYLASHRANGK